MSVGRGKTSKLSSPPLPFYHKIKRVICRPFSLTGQNNNETWPPPHVATDTYALLNKMDADVHDMTCTQSISGYLKLVN